MSDSGEPKTPAEESQVVEIESKSPEEMTKNSKKRALDLAEDSDNESWLENHRRITKKPTRRNIASDYEKTEEETLKEEEDDDDNDALPLTCSICNQPFLNPVVTKCQHYFCETCGFKHDMENDKCFVCNQPTLGVYDTAMEIKGKITEQREKAKAMVKEVSTMVEKASAMVDDAGGIAEKAVKLVEEVETMVRNAAEMATNAGKMAAEAAEMVQEANATMETAKADMAKAFAVMKTVTWDDV
ncbi:unnamed protein product [Arabis nemorensis]|uniref:RING-type domain-containing protein n=1 Tax=Arabis nemorensis TaxID=586526 RepID=A0A565BZT3_9BRAS|nr:unnamed protein product [Arabis nemorensis]